MILLEDVSIYPATRGSQSKGTVRICIVCAGKDSRTGNWYVILSRLRQYYILVRQDDATLISGRISTAASKLLVGGSWLLPALF